MKRITEKRLAEIKAFKSIDFSDAPELTDEQLAQMKPSHLRNKAISTPVKTKVKSSLNTSTKELSP